MHGVKTNTASNSATLLGRSSSVISSERALRRGRVTVAQSFVPFTHDSVYLLDAVQEDTKLSGVVHARGRGRSPSYRVNNADELDTRNFGSHTGLQHSLDRYGLGIAR